MGTFLFYMMVLNQSFLYLILASFAIDSPLKWIVVSLYCIVALIFSYTTSYKLSVYQTTQSSYSIIQEQMHATFLFYFIIFPLLSLALMFDPNPHSFFMAADREGVRGIIDSIEGYFNPVYIAVFLSFFVDKWGLFTGIFVILIITVMQLPFFFVLRLGSYFEKRKVAYLSMRISKN